MGAHRPRQLDTWLRGTLHGVCPKHVQRDLDEFRYPFDRRWREGELFGVAMRRVAGGHPLAPTRGGELGIGREDSIQCRQALAS